MDFLHEKKEPITTPALLTGKVVANYDDNFKGMVQVELYNYAENRSVTDWIRVASPAAGKGRGIYFLPEIGDEVIVAFIGGDITNAAVIGSLWNEASPQPDDAVTKENTTKTIVTKAGIKLLISDEKDKEKIVISTPKNVTLSMTDESDTVVIKCGDDKNKIEINGKNGEISLSSKNKLILEGADVQIKSKGNLKIEASGMVEIKGSMVKLNG